mgnify:CR=1 FL=1
MCIRDRGSNSFRLEVGRVEGDQVFRLDTWRETLRRRPRKAELHA